MSSTHEDETRLIGLLLAAASGAAGVAAQRPVGLLTATFDWIDKPEPEEAVAQSVEITRATRTLVFARAIATGRDQRPLLHATTVHKAL